MKTDPTGVARSTNSLYNSYAYYFGERKPLMTQEAQRDALAEDSAGEIERDHELALCGLKLEDIVLEPEECGHGWSATVGPYDLGCRIGTGATRDKAIDDLIAQLDEIP
jgi:hypothetical protein